ncbi:MULTISPECIES: DUF3099 domain-containing protein [Arthrobacter]|uniref:DUF3099 domain-containing protein n=1 Tax=Arthrobacter TaxID=1663 RepID=UPI00339A518F
MKEQSATPKFGARRRSKSRRGEPSTPVQAITNAAIAHSEDMRHRMIQYSLTMGIRMVCLVLIFVFDGWFKIVPIVGAVVLPWVAVMLANGGADTVHQETVELLDEAPLYAVTDAEFTTDGTDSSSEGILQGEIVPDDADTDVTEPDATVPVETTPDETTSDEMGGQGP